LRVFVPGERRKSKAIKGRDEALGNIKGVLRGKTCIRHFDELREMKRVNNCQKEGFSPVRKK